MKKAEVLHRIKESGIVPVIRASSLDQAQRIIESAYNSGYSIFEITMTVPNAVELIKQLSQRYGSEVLLGAGTVLSVESARSCLDSGAKFIVTPCLIKEIIDFCQREEVLICAGALTPTEVFHAFQTGADVIKIFPVNSIGGVDYIKALKAPFPEIQFMPTGGLKVDDQKLFIEAGAIAIGVGFKEQ